MYTTIRSGNYNYRIQISTLMRLLAQNNQPQVHNDESVPDEQTEEEDEDLNEQSDEDKSGAAGQDNSEMPDDQNSD